MNINKIALILFLTIVLVFAVSSAGFADYYKYTDQKGQVCYTEDISNVPVDQRENIKTYKSSTTSNNVITNKSKDEVLYYNKESSYKIINRNGGLLAITKNPEDYDIYTEIGHFPEDYPKDLPAPGTHID